MPNLSNGHPLCRILIDVKSPSQALPQYFAYLHAVAADPSYCWRGNLRPSEEHCFFHYTLHGRGECFDKTGRYTVTAGQGFLSIANDPQSGYEYPKDGTEDWEFLCFCFLGGNCIDMVRAMIDTYGTVYSLPEDHSILRVLGNERYFMENQPFSAIGSSRYFYDLCSALIRLVGEQRPDPFSTCVDKAIRIIDDRCEKGITVEKLASMLGLSREHLSRSFFAERGVTLRDYIRHKRILHACMLLKTTHMKVSEIAEAMEFSSPANFSRYFSEAIGLSPQTFRAVGNIPEF